MSVPGVNVIVAATFLAAIGDIHRFKNPRKLVGYLGLDPKGAPVRARPGDAAATSQSKARCVRVTRWSRRAGRGPPARTDARVLSARPLTPRPLRRDRRRRQKARVPVLVPAHPRAGLRLRAAVTDRARSCGASRSPPAPPTTTRQPAGVWAPTSGCAKPNASSPSRPSTPTRNGPRLARRTGQEGGRERDTGARIKQAQEGQSRAADHKPLTSALRSSARSAQKSVSSGTSPATPCCCSSSRLPSP
jgi:hypothetical protein